MGTRKVFTHAANVVPSTGLSYMHVISMVHANPEVTKDCLHATKEVLD